MRRMVRIAAPAVVVLAFAAFVWPTPWEYHRAAEHSNVRGWLLRRNRFTGAVDWLGLEGWTRCAPRAATEPGPRPFDAFDQVFGRPTSKDAVTKRAFETKDAFERLWTDGEPTDAPAGPDPSPAK